MRQSIWKRLTDKRSLICILFLLIFTNIVVPSVAKAETKENNYLVLIQNNDNTWTAYDNLIEKSPEGSLMVKAKLISEKLNYSYQILKNGNFTIQKSQFRNNIYEKGNEEYTFQCSSSALIAKTTVNAPYTSEISGHNVCHFSTLNTMLYSKYFPASTAKEYKEEGYKGVICYSKYGKITEVPSWNEVISDSYAEESMQYTESKLIIVGDSRSNNMSKWVKTSVDTEFITKEGEGYEWFCNEAIKKVNSIKKPGDVILIWLGVNDYNSDKLGMKSWVKYADKINDLADNQWKDCIIYVAEVGYVNSNIMNKYYGKKTKSNVTQLYTGTKIKGIRQFNVKLKGSLNDTITWITTNSTLGIQSNDNKIDQKDIWITKSNGKKDGLHYGKEITQRVYDYFVQKIMMD